MEGFQLSEELVMLRDQVRRIIQGEIIPVEQGIDPDAAEIPEADYRRIAKLTQDAGFWCGTAGTSGGTFS